MTTELFDDLLAAQMAMPPLHKTAENPFYHNKYVPLEAVLDAVLPILNAHNFVLLQQPSTVDGKPALTTTLFHRSGERLTETMLLCMKDATPQEQGSGLTYARRYALLATLGLTADVDDDAEATRREVPQQVVNARRAERTVNTTPMPVCPDHGPTKLVPAGTSKAGKPYGAFYSCLEKSCEAGANGRGWTMFEDKWVMELQLARGKGEPAFAGVDPDAELPFE